MRLLLDTNALIWWVEEDGRLGHNASEAIASPTNEVLVSVVWFWEVAVKLRVGKIRLDLPTLGRAVRDGGFRRTGVEDEHLRRLVGLPMHHRDPFDHLPITQAVEEDAFFVTSDRAMRACPVKLLDARA